MIQDGTLQKIYLFFINYQQIRYRKKDMVLRADDEGEHVYFIEDGYLRVFRLNEEGEELTLVILKPHDFFPVTFGLSNNPNNYYLEALSPLKILRAPKSEFLAFLKDHPDIYFEVANKTLTRLDSILKRLEYLVTGRASTKIATTLIICAKHFGDLINGSIILKIPLTHKDIATLVGITRETTSLEMKKLEKKGLVSYQGRMLVINDVEKLEEEALLDLEEETQLINSL